jgi:predicted RNA-binding Zn-ribbon protein involved in translation (DUF1610 family)
MRFSKAKKVYSCCGQYLVPIDKAVGKAIKCPRCGDVIKSTVRKPSIVIITEED